MTQRESQSRKSIIAEISMGWLLRGKWIYRQSQWEKWLEQRTERVRTPCSRRKWVRSWTLKGSPCSWNMEKRAWAQHMKKAGREQTTKVLEGQVQPSGFILRAMRHAWRFWSRGYMTASAFGERELWFWSGNYFGGGRGKNPVLSGGDPSREGWWKWSLALYHGEVGRKDQWKQCRQK